MPTKLLGLALLFSAACGGGIHHKTDVSAPQRYRPQGATEQWVIEGKLDTELLQNAMGDDTVGTRTLVVTINGESVAQGPLGKDEDGLPSGTLDGSYADAKVNVTCSSQRKSDS